MLSARTLHRLEALLALWVALWIAAGTLGAIELGSLGDLGDTVVKAGVAVRSTGDALGSISSLPLVPGSVGRVASEAREAGRSAIVNGRASQGSVRRLAYLVGFVFALLPTLPALAAYVVLRRRWSRDRAAIAAAVRGGAGDDLVELLAGRARASLPLERARGLGRVALANAELQRLGIRARLEGEPT